MTVQHFDLQCYEHLLTRFQNIFEDELISEICHNGQLRQYDVDEMVVDIDERVDTLPLIVSGSLKILTEDEEGKELLLYYLELGDTCAVTLNCASKATKSKIRAVTESKTEILFVPMSKVDDWMSRYRSWRNFILETYNYRLNEMLAAIDTLAFHNMEERVYKYLRDKAMVTGTQEITATHFQIANDLHSSRVVISRILSKLEQDGLIEHGRNWVKIVQM